jgi:hypothetical protein
MVHKILKRMNGFIFLNCLDEPFWIFNDVYKGDTRALYSSLQRILDEELAYGFEVVEYVPRKGLQLDTKKLVVTDSGKQFASMSNFQICKRALFNKAVDKFYQMQDDMYSTMEKYENYSDEQLIRMVKKNNFPNQSHRMIVAKILKERGYTKESVN